MLIRIKDPSNRLNVLFQKCTYQPQCLINRIHCEWSYYSLSSASMTQVRIYLVLSDMTLRRCALIE